MKKRLGLILALVFILVGCSGADSPTTAADTKEGSAEKETVVPQTAVEVYTGYGTGYGGDLGVEVTLLDGKIIKVEITEHSDTQVMYDMVLEQLVPEIIGAGSVDGVDIVAGATETSNGVIEAVKNALQDVG